MTDVLKLVILIGAAIAIAITLGGAMFSGYHGGSGYWDRFPKGAPKPNYSYVAFDGGGSAHYSRFVTRNWNFERWTPPNSRRLPWRHYRSIPENVVMNSEVGLRAWLKENAPGWTARGYDSTHNPDVAQWREPWPILFSFRSAKHAALFQLVWG